MLNNWCGQGRLTGDVVLRYTQTQVPVASFSIACERDYKPKEGDRETDFIDIVAWNSSAEFVEKYFKKGDMILVSGRLQTRTYEDKNGNKRKAVEVVGTTFNFCGNKGSTQDAGGQQRGGRGQQYNGGQQYGGQNAGQNGRQPQGQYRSQQYAQDPLDGFMSIPDGIDEELPFG